MDEVEVSAYDLRVSLSMTAYAVPPEPDDEIEHWRAVLLWAENPADEKEVATADFLVVPQGLPDPALSLDALSANAAFFAAMFDGRRFDDALDLEGYDGVVIVDRLHVRTDMRGQGLGPLLVAEALHRLGRDCAAAACDDSPLGTSDCADRSAIRRMIRDFGFSEWRDGLWTLDLATTGLEATRQSIHEARLRPVD